LAPCSCLAPAPAPAQKRDFDRASERHGCGLIRDVERRTLFPDGQVGLVPLFLRGAVGVALQRGLVGKLHDEGVGLVTLDLDGLNPNAGDPLVFGGQRHVKGKTTVGFGLAGSGMVTELSPTARVG
jgi:hypothetical protein